MMPDITIPYTPRPLQLKFHDERKRFCVMICHRRFGKTVAAINDLIRRAIRSGKRDWRAGYVAPFLKQAKAVAWDYLKYFAGVIPGARFHESELRCDLRSGQRLRLFGADNPEALRGMYFDDLVLDEPGDMPRAVWTTILRPTLADRLGSALFIGTPKGTGNLLHDVYQEALADPEHWSLFVFKASESGYLRPDELEAIRKSLLPDEYEQEFECSFAAAVRGAYYAAILDRMERDGRICPVSWEPALLVNTAWDLGVDDATAIWFFQIEPRGDWRIIDYYENSGEGLPHYAALLQAKPYNYGRHTAPHDIRVRELGTGKSRLEAARELGIRFDPCPNIPVVDGINAVRTKLPRMWFDAAKCAEGLKALRHYRKTWNPRSELFEKPLHDWTSHPADAMRYAVVGMREERGNENRQSQTVNKKPAAKR